MKKQLRLLAFCLFSFGLFGHAQTTKIVFATGGAFLATGNQVTVHLYDTQSGSIDTLDQVLGDFTNGIIRDGQYAFAHIGRSAFNPDPIGEETIYKYDLISHTRVDSIVGIPGAFKFAVWEDYFIVGKGFGGSGSQLEIYDKNDLSAGPIFEDSAIAQPVGGLIVVGGKLYVGFTENGQGNIARYDLSASPVFDGIFPLNAAAAGLGDMLSDGQYIYGFAEYYDPVTFDLISAGVVKFDLTSHDFQTQPTSLANTPLGIKAGVLYGNFGSDGNDLDTETLLPVGTVTLPPYAAGKLDTAQNVFYLLETDFASFGQLSAVDFSGDVLFTLDTDISGTAIDLVTNHCPEFTQTDLFLFMYFGDQLTEPLSPYVTDVDGDALSFSITMPPMYLISEIDSSNNLLLTDIGNSSGFDDLEITVTDIWGCSDVVAVSIELGIIGTTTSNFWEEKEVSVFPNPTPGTLSVQLPEFKNEAAQIEVFNINQQRVLHFDQHIHEKLNLEVQNIPPGHYQILIRGEKHAAFGRFVKI